jgi:multiple sugar transport system permease protein
MRRLLLVFLTASVALCSGAHAAQDLILWGLALDADNKGREAVMREFQRRHPEYNVRNVSVAGSMDRQKLMTSIVGDVAPDVINQDRFTISDWASRGAFQPLDDLIKQDAKRDPLSPEQADYYPSTWEESTYLGHVYGIPAEADNRALYWNRAIFRAHAADLKKAGLDPNRPPRTWSELFAYEKVLTVKNADGTFKTAGFFPNYGNSWLYMYAFENNAQFLSPNGHQCTLTNPDMEEALQYIVKGYDAIGGYEAAKGFETSFLSNENDPFIAGQVAMKVDGDWILNAISRYAPTLDFAVAPPPVPDDRFYHRGRFANEKDTYITWTGGFAYAIPRGARNSKGGWEFIKFASSVEGRMIEAGAQAEWEAQHGRVFMPVMQANRIANEAVFRKYKPADPKLASALRVHLDLMLVGRTRPVTFVAQVMWDECQRALENACLHALTPHQALQRAQGTVQHELDDYYSHADHPLADFRPLANLLIVLILALAVLAFVAFKKRKLRTLARHEARWAYGMISPWVFGFLVFTLGPMLASFVFSFTEYNALTDARWVGIRNYTSIAAVDHVNIAKAFSNAFYLAAVGVPLGILTGLSIALLLNSKVRGLTWYRTLFYLPAIVPTIPSAILWTWVLTSDPHRGLVNAFWQQTITAWFSLPPPGWLQSEAWAKPALIAMGLWGAGSGMILWLAGLKGISQSHLEAAQLDGASPRQQFFSVSLPQLTPIIFFNLVMGFIAAIQEFDRVYIMKPSDETVGPGDSLLTPVYYLFQNAFGYFKMGYASALAWLIFLIIVILTFIQFKLAPRWVRYEAD